MVRHIHKTKTLLLTATCLSILSACAVGPDYKAPSQNSLSVPQSWSHQDNTTLLRQGELSPQQMADWWQIFKDPALERLIAQTLNANLDIAQGKERLIQAREAAIQTGAAFAPQINGSGSGGRNITSGGDDNNSYSVGADAAWEIDIFGRLARTREAALADVEAGHYTLADIRTSILAETVTNYIQLRLAQKRYDIAADTLNNQNENYEIAHWRAEAGLVSSLDEEQARAQRAQTASSIPLYKQSIDNAIHRLSVLSGQVPEALRNDLQPPQDMPKVMGTIATGIPADILRQRPDVMTAERNLAAANARIGVAKSDLFPALNLTANIGTTALTPGGLGDIVTSSVFAGLSQLLFDGGAATSRLRASRSATQEAYLNYKQIVLVALEDVENALVALKTSEERRDRLREADSAAGTSASLARNQYQAGLTDFQTLLSAENTYLTARDSLASAEADRLLAITQLYTSLGGGWSNTPVASQNSNAGQGQ